MNLIIPKKAEEILQKLNDKNFDAYIVGGCVRDCLLKRVPQDWDITTSAEPYQVKKIFNKTYDTGLQHGTITVCWKGEHYEVTTYRIDKGYDDCRHPNKVIFTKNLKEDLQRRDFTINAMAYNDKNGLVDIRLFFRTRGLKSKNNTRGRKSRGAFSRRCAKNVKGITFFCTIRI